MGTCEICGTPLSRSARGRPQTRFCSSECKNKGNARDRRQRALEAAGERKCLNCGTLLPDSLTLKAKCCSVACNTAWQNKKKADARIARWRDEDLHCERCGKPIPVPETGSRRTKYCSAECKKAEMDQRWRERSPGFMRQYLYGITPEQWLETWDAQDGKCAICGTDNWGGRHDKPHADHCHETGKFRGILCDECNRAIGILHEDPARLRAAAAYLEAAMT